MNKNDPSQLFASLRLELNRHWHHVQAQAEQDVLSFPPGAIDQLGYMLFSNLARGGFCTSIVSGRNTWEPRSQYFEAARAAARRGRVIERAFLLPHRYHESDVLLREHIGLDNAAGIATSVLFVGDLLATMELASFYRLDFGLWDDELVCTVVHRTAGWSSGPSEWSVSGRREDIQLAQSIIEILKTKAERIVLDESSATTLQHQRLNLEEPMVSTAPVMDFISASVCQGNHVSADDCSWYHSIWQYLRIFNMVSTPTWHTEFYRDELGALAKTGNFNRALISGTADYSMLAHLLWAYRVQKSRVIATVVDLCESPLLLCKWYAKRVDEKVTTAVSDILKFESVEPFDLIVTDAFLTRFPPEMRSQIVRKWALLLRPGGKVVTTVRIETGLGAEYAVATPDQADAFRKRAMQEAQRWQDFLPLSPEVIANRAQRYAERMISFSIKSIDEIRQLFEDQSFQIDDLRTTVVPGEMASTAYAQIVATRR